MNKRTCVLLVDDDSGTNFINKLILSRVSSSLPVETVLNGKEAIDFIKSSRNKDVVSEQYFENILIFLDINMPVMDGWCFLEAFKLLPDDYKKNVSIIMLTTSLNPEDKLRSDTYSEVSGFYNKPLSIVIVKEILNTHFSY